MARRARSAVHIRIDHHQLEEIAQQIAAQAQDTLNDDLHQLAVSHAGDRAAFIEAVEGYLAGSPVCGVTAEQVADTLGF